MAFIAFANKMTLLGECPDSCLHQHIGNNQGISCTTVHYVGGKSLSKLSSMFKSQEIIIETSHDLFCHCSLHCVNLPALLL